MINEHSTTKKEKQKVHKEISKFKDSIDKASESFAACEKNCLKLSEKIARREAEFAKNNGTVESALKIWDMLGLRIQQISDGEHFEGGDKLVEGDFAIRISKVDPQDPNRVFIVKVNITGHQVKSRCICFVGEKSYSNFLFSKFLKQNPKILSASPTASISRIR